MPRLLPMPGSCLHLSVLLVPQAAEPASSLHAALPHWPHRAAPVTARLGGVTGAVTAGLKGDWGLPSAGASPRTIAPDRSLRRGTASRRGGASGSPAPAHAADLGEVAANQCQLGEHGQHPPAVRLPAERTAADCLHARLRDLPAEGAGQPGWPAHEALSGSEGGTSGVGMCLLPVEHR